MYDSRRPNSSQRSSQHMESSPREDYYLEEKQKNSPPRNGWIYSIIIGLVGGIIALFIPIIIVYANASLYREGARLGESMPSETAGLILALGAGGAFGGAFIVFLFGMFAGWMGVKRWQSFLAGALAGGIVYLGIFFVHYVPGYPDIISSDARTSATGTVVQAALAFLILVFVYALVGGLVSRGGRACGLWLRRLLGK